MKTDKQMRQAAEEMADLQDMDRAELIDTVTDIRARLDEQVKVAEWFHTAALAIDGLVDGWTKRMRYCRQVADSEPDNVYPRGTAAEEADALHERIEAAHLIREALHDLPGWSGAEGPTTALTEEVRDLRRQIAEREAEVEALREACLNIQSGEGAGYCPACGRHYDEGHDEGCPVQDRSKTRGDAGRLPTPLELHSPTTDKEG